MLYPLKFQPIYKDKIWGGHKIRTVLNKDYSPLSKCGESWELSGVEDNLSIVRDGSLAGKNLKELIQLFKGDLAGHRVYRKYKDRFPLLIKFIDANDDLSIQVHPDDTLARERHGSYGKTEMWYIIQSDKDAEIITGFNRETDKETYLDYFKKGKLTEILNTEKVKAGDVVFMPAGRVHSIGKGILLAEIQQTSNITYRIYDFDRVNEKGKPRELHVNEALDAIDYSYYPEYKIRYKNQKNHPVKIVSCDYFTTSKLWFDKPLGRNYRTLDSFVSLICLEGSGSMTYENGMIEIKQGEVIVIPAIIDQADLIPDGEMKILETHITL